MPSFVTSYDYEEDITLGRVGITYEQVAEASDKLIATNQIPTVERVRRALGDTGSNTYIAKYLRDWKNERLQTASQTSERQNLSLSDALTKAVTSLLEKIRAESEAENTQIRETAESTVAQITEENSALQEKLTIVQTNLQETQLVLNHLQADYQLAQQALIEERKKNAVLLERVKHAEENVQKIQVEMQQRLVEQQQLHTAIVEHLKNEMVKLQTQHQHTLSDLKEQSEKQRQKLIVEIDQLRVAKQKAENAHLKSAMELAQQQKGNVELKEQTKGLETDLKVLEQAYQTLKQDYEKVDKQLLVVNTENQQKDVMLANLREQFQLLTKNLISNS